MPEARKRKGFAVYAIVRCGGRQEKVTVEDVLAVDKVAGEVGSTVTLPAVLVVDDGKVVSDPKQLARYEVTAEILGESKGPKLNIMHYKSKTGYKRRLGHRQTYTQVKITDIAGEGKSAAKLAAAAAEAKAESATAEAGTTKAPAKGKSTAKPKATAATKTKAATGKAKASGAAKTTAKSATKAADKPKTTQKPRAKKAAESKAEEN